LSNSESKIPKFVFRGYKSTNKGNDWKKQQSEKRTYCICGSCWWCKLKAIAKKRKTVIKNKKKGVN